VRIIMSPVVTNHLVAWSICMPVSVTLVHPAKAAGRHEMPLVPSNSLLDRNPSCPTGRDDWGLEPYFWKKILTENTTLRMLICKLPLIIIIVPYEMYSQYTAWA